MKNERGAGRKAVISSDDIAVIKERIGAGESVTAIAKECGITRQALYKRLKDETNHMVTLDYIVDGKVATRIELDCRKEQIKIENYALRISQYAFGLVQNPTWDDLGTFLEKQILLSDGLEKCSSRRLLFQEIPRNEFSITDVSSNSDRFVIHVDEAENIPRFPFTQKDILYSRTDTDGYQLKAISRDRRFFVKSQAIISGINMNDWAVELVASDLCEQLGIPCVKQMECEFVYGGRIYKGVYSANFELDGYTFVSFESLLERIGTSSNEQEFIKLDAIGKMKWCAEKLSQAGNIGYEEAFKYMLDLAVIDCLTGNIDRHTRNFGLFYNCNAGRYEIPLVFDNGMGLFENDGYRDKYLSFDDAMRHVYVAPYGEDPFELLDMLKKEYDLTQYYNGATDIRYNCLLDMPFANTYMERMRESWRK